jgi:protoporphyrinogen oxidase
MNTAPLHALLSLLDNEAPAELHTAVAELKYKPTVIFAILVKREKCMNGLYTYYRNRTFHRVGEPKNAGLIVNPEGHTILIVESTCELDDYKWQGSDRYKNEIITDLVEENICLADEIVSWNLMRSPHGYPIYTNGFDTYLDQIQAWIDQQSNLSSTGRQGGFCYPAMHTAMQLGKDAAKEIIQHHAS